MVSTTAENTPESEGAASPVPARWAIDLFVISVLGLFLELMLIRWISTEIRIFAYLQNTVLVVCFLGLGVGCLAARTRTFSIQGMLLPLVALLVILAFPSTRAVFASISERLSGFGDLVIWDQGKLPLVSSCVGLVLTLAVMILLWEIFVPLGILLGQLIDRHPRTILAYSVNVAGSLAGVWLFVGLSAIQAPPAVWLAFAAFLMLWFVDRSARLSLVVLEVGLILATPGLAWLASLDHAPDAIAVVWSPYQKLALHGTASTRSYYVLVNNVGYQAMFDNSEAATAAKPAGQRGFSQYDIPFLLHPNPRTALLVGAGSGNDAAGALRNGVAQVTAVEIDPAIVDFGRKYHPEAPYASPRVKVVVDDARSFFATTRERYDVICFGLLDSHTTTTMTNARLDNYVYTRESIERAKELLAPGGIVVLSFAVQREFIGNRIAQVLADVFGENPLIFRVPGGPYGWGGMLFVAGGEDAARRQLSRNPRLAELVGTWQRTRWTPRPPYSATVAVDDWPYLYLESNQIPALYYLLAILLMLLVTWGRVRLGVRGVVGEWRRSNWHFFFLGAAFMLLEVQNISKASVVLGNTWQVNAVIISAVLVMVLLANAIAAWVPRLSTRLVCLLLCGSCVGLFFADLARFAFLPYPAKVLVVGLLTCVPMLFSGIVFIRSFARTGARDAALGANLLGSLAGGLLQSLTFITGIRALLLVVAGLYLVAIAARSEDQTAVPASLPAKLP